MSEFIINLTKKELKDPLTGELFVPKNSRQLFACRQNQIKYNNLKAKKNRERTAYVNKPLLKNFRILEELLKDTQEATFHEEFLLGKGYSFKVNTGVETYQGKNHFTIYHYVVIQNNDNTFKIIKL